MEELQYGQCEGGGLAGACLGTAKHIPSFKHQRDGLFLDGGGDGVAFGLDGTEQRLHETEFIEWHYTILFLWQMQSAPGANHILIGGSAFGPWTGCMVAKARGFVNVKRNARWRGLADSGPRR